jgi:hypothetical protein
MTNIYKVAALALLLISCNNTNQSGGAFPETQYCSSMRAISNGLTISGKATYQRRESTASGLGSPEATNYPIRYAEVSVTGQHTGSQIQCGQTDSNGNFSLQIPRGAGNLRLAVRARADNEYVKASVLDTPDTNSPYYVQITFVAEQDLNLGELTAPATGSIEGGAFNIYDQILKANEYLRSQTANCQATFSECAAFSVAPKVTIYWKAGVNPANYFGITSAISFFHQESGMLYILGGSDGDTDTSDTDHFDNSVVVHEYSHFLIDALSKSDSPGGSHDANSVIDPRLAWDEGWANFFALAVTGDPVYRDTYGNVDGSTGIFFSHNLETNSPSRDNPSANGEGNFREFSIARALWDIIDPHPISLSGTNELLIDSVTGPFAEFWTVLTATGGYKTSNYHFRNYGLFMQLRANLTGASDVSTVLTAEKQLANQTDYATQNNLSGTCTYTLTTTGTGEDGSYARSNQFRSNDFYYYYHSGGMLTISLNRTGGAGDLDLYLYGEDYVYGDSSSMAASSHDPASSDGGTEEVSAYFPAGHFMINVMLYTVGAAATADYKLLINGVELCP